MPEPEDLPVAGCLFCGSLPQLEPAVHHGFTISCNAYECPVQPETRPFDTAEQAAAAWNGRA
ncbi:hypothetical protein HHL22_20670 [Hymenobacter sp. RP-2-7]|uniref:Restriction alleviation protein, Lar family n=1 Tax=Hymenobacter polaris TaxID=2682546 RepID=A0A7Y0AI46_9BACT|nr:hypothetical protein [Hymenobacter polaris]NML67622.1 hypothetical protein [Hymenobacter polaris]